MQLWIWRQEAVEFRLRKSPGAHDITSDGGQQVLLLMNGAEDLFCRYRRGRP